MPRSLHPIFDSVNWSSNTVKMPVDCWLLIEKLSFSVTLVVVQNVMGYLKAVTKLLQKWSVNIVWAIALVGEVQKLLEEIRADIDEWHSVWFTMAQEISEEEGTEGPVVPRRCV